MIFGMSNGDKGWVKTNLHKVRNERKRKLVLSNDTRQLFPGQPSDITRVLVQVLQAGPGQRFRWCHLDKDEWLADIEAIFVNSFKVPSPEHRQWNWFEVLQLLCNRL